MTLLPADYVLAAITVILAGMGLFRGFSGVFAFVTGLAIAGSSVFFGWSTFLQRFESVWTRGLVALVLFMLVFGVARYLVKQTVGKLLSQPSDAIFGFCFGLFCGLLLVWAVSMNPAMRERSAVAKMVNSHVDGTDP